MLTTKYMQVSIPLWFDWKKVPRSNICYDAEFQFHFGSIGRFGRVHQIQFHKGFNSTLVRLEVTCIPEIEGEVLCFNSTLVRLEEKPNGENLTFSEFQFHFGSIGSGIGILRDELSGVSIPLWFDWKR